jgi:hypothetical protein
MAASTRRESHGPVIAESSQPMSLQRTLEYTARRQCRSPSLPSDASAEPLHRGASRLIHPSCNVKPNRTHLRAGGATPTTGAQPTPGGANWRRRSVYHRRAGTVNALRRSRGCAPNWWLTASAPRPVNSSTEKEYRWLTMTHRSACFAVELDKSSIASSAPVRVSA